MMLPGVEIARRRRVRAGQGRVAYDCGVSRSETHRSRLAVSGAHNHLRLGTSAGCCRSQALLRVQETLQEQRSDRSSGTAAAVASGNNQNATQNVDNNHGDRALAQHHRSREETRGSKLSSLWRRHSSCSQSDPGGLAILARNRLDELLQAAAHATHTRNSSCRTLTPRLCAQSSHTTGSVDSHGYHLGENRRRASVYDWLATCVLSMKQRLKRVEVTSSTSLSSSTSHTSRSSTTTSSRASGLSNGMIEALPSEAMGANEPDQNDDCPVCLEGLMAGETTITLLCNHTFHPRCLTPWISKHGRCPCCRTSVARHKHNQNSTQR